MVIDMHAPCSFAGYPRSQPSQTVAAAGIETKDQAVAGADAPLVCMTSVKASDDAEGRDVVGPIGSE